MTHTHTLTLLFEVDLSIYTITIHIPAENFPRNFKPSGIYDYLNKPRTQFKNSLFMIFIVSLSNPKNTLRLRPPQKLPYIYMFNDGLMGLMGY